MKEVAANGETVVLRNGGISMAEILYLNGPLSETTVFEVAVFSPR